MDNDDIPSLTAHNDNANDGTPRLSPAAQQAPPVISGTLVSLQIERVQRDKRLCEIENMMDEAVKLAKERLLFAAIDGDSAHTEGAYVKQWVMIANCYTKLLTTTHKQIEFLRQER